MIVGGGGMTSRSRRAPRGVDAGGKGRSGAAPDGPEPRPFRSGNASRR